METQPSPNSSRSQKNNADELQIRKMMNEVSAAIKARDIEGILSAYADDAVVYDVRDALQIDKEGLRQSWQECFDTSKEFKNEYHDLKIETCGDIAFGFCLGHSQGIANNGESVDIWLRDTMAFHREGSQWKIFHEHISAPGDFTSGKVMQDLKPTTLQ